MTDCFTYFSKSLAKINSNRLFDIPSWIPKLSDPEVQFNLDPPTYQQITNVIRKMKSSGSPCPLDQLSIICFKRCPYLRTYLSELMADIINKARIRQRSVVITLLDLKNAFGEIHHNLIQSVLDYQVPPHPRAHKIRYKKFIH